MSSRSLPTAGKMFLDRTVARLRRVLKGFIKERSSFLAFVRSNQTALWKISYFVIAAFLFAAAAQKRFSWPQVPLANYDSGYLQPVLMKLNGDAFAHIQGLNFLYPKMVYLILPTWADFRPISVIQHFFTSQGTKSSYEIAQAPASAHLRR